MQAQCIQQNTSSAVVAVNCFMGQDSTYPPGEL